MCFLTDLNCSQEPVQKQNGVSVMLLAIPTYQTKVLTLSYYTATLLRSIGFEMHKTITKIS